jgi:hypothetical protein
MVFLSITVTKFENLMGFKLETLSAIDFTTFFITITFVHSSELYSRAQARAPFHANIAGFKCRQQYHGINSEQWEKVWRNPSNLWAYVLWQIHRAVAKN